MNSCAFVRSSFFARVVGLFALVALCVLVFPSLSISAERGPNVVLILGDDQAWTDFGFMGHPTIATPHLDRLASQGAVFTHGYVPTSLCRASLATFATGLFPHQHGITSNDPPPGVDRSLMLRHMSGHATIPRLLAPAGYLSLQTGKWWEGQPALGGFTHAMSHGDPTRGGRHGDVGLTIGREGLAPIGEFFDTVGERPFFLWYAPLLPHMPHNPPQRLLEKYSAPDRHPQLAAYWAMCEWFDETIGELLALLDERGLAENTLVVFAVDNGWIQETGEAKTTRGGFAPKSKLSPYDGGVRTPVIVCWPGHVSPTSIATPISTVDLVPTMLTACGVAPPSHLPGTNLLEVATGSPYPRDTICGEIFTHNAVDIDRPAANLTHRWCVAGNRKLIVPAKSPALVELYDLANDPTETKNIAAEEPETVARLRTRLDAWWPGK
ncbi:MAG: sulfatase-like hydrolase/transferase [Pirellulales bacterium]|nr:sulfatase-like hydrolase/transferase [Pirellulales bacterium]